MTDHIDNDFIDQVVDVLQKSGFNAHNDNFNSTFSIDLFVGEPVEGARTFMFGTANDTWGGSGALLEGDTFQPDETDQGYAETNVSLDETDPQAVAFGVILSILGLHRYTVPTQVWHGGQLTEF